MVGEHAAEVIQGMAIAIKMVPPKDLIPHLAFTQQ